MLSKPVQARVGGDFSPIPADLYQVQIVDVDLVTQMNPFKGKEEELLNYKFAILDEKQDGEGKDLRGRFLWKRMSPTFNDRSWALKLVKAIWGDMSQEELKNFDFNTPIGKQVKVMVEEKPSRDGNAVFNNITSFVLAKKPLKEVEYESKPSEIHKESAPVATEDELKELGL